MMPLSKNKKKYDEWEVRNSVDTLLKAEEIKANPVLMKLCDVEIKKKQTALKNLTGNEMLELSKKDPKKFKEYIKSK